ncbi:MAG: N-acetylmuramoyl-L-alanine amidase [Bacteroidales bacterium]|nr:N-acetylmuramoyl-L-alanine amidase [Bacteroidales bacterium]
MSKKRIERLVIHCTATPEGREVTVADIRRWHCSPQPQGRGWKQVGYTDMVHLDGRVERLVENNEDAYVDGWEVTNGAKGYNSTSRHIVYVGGLRNGIPADTRTEAQKAALKAYVEDFRKRFPWADVCGHRDLSPDLNGDGIVTRNEWTKSCPCFDVRKEYGI